MRIELQHVSVRTGDATLLADVSLAVSAGECMTLVGPSGAGKSTLLRVVAGLTRPTSGSVILDGVDARALATNERRLGFVFQNGALFPHRDVAGNVGYGLEISGVAGADRARRVSAALELVGLVGFEHRRVDSLSGGEVMRVALARALAPEPRALLLDEPFGALDGPRREGLQRELRSLITQLGLTTIHVTHDIGEALALGDRVALLRRGVLVQVATPGDLWHAPTDGWTAEFLGMRNIEPLPDGRMRVTRPDGVRVTPAGEATGTVAAPVATVAAVDVRGATAGLVLELGDGRSLEAVVLGQDVPERGSRVAVSVDPGAVLDLPAERAPAGRATEP